MGEVKTFIDCALGKQRASSFVTSHPIDVEPLVQEVYDDDDEAGNEEEEEQTVIVQCDAADAAELLYEEPDMLPEVVALVQAVIDSIVAQTHVHQLVSLVFSHVVELAVLGEKLEAAQADGMRYQNKAEELTGDVSCLKEQVGGLRGALASSQQEKAHIMACAEQGVQDAVDYASEKNRRLQEAKMSLACTREHLATSVLELTQEQRAGIQCERQLAEARQENEGAMLQIADLQQKLCEAAVISASQEAQLEASRARVAEALSIATLAIKSKAQAESELQAKCSELQALQSQVLAFLQQQQQQQQQVVQSPSVAAAGVQWWEVEPLCLTTSAQAQQVDAGWDSGQGTSQEEEWSQEDADQEINAWSQSGCGC